MGTRPRLPLQTSTVAISLLAASSRIERFTPKRWPHHRALWELRDLCGRGAFGQESASWQFEPSPDGGYALVGLDDVFLVLSEEGWLRRETDRQATYVVSAELRDRGATMLRSLCAEDRRLVAQVARRWSARVRTLSKNVA